MIKYDILNNTVTVESNASERQDPKVEQTALHELCTHLIQNNVVYATYALCKSI